MNNENEEQVLEGEISLADIWNTVRRRFLLILLCLVVAIFVAIFSLQGKIDMYQSSATLIIQKPSNYGQSALPDYYSSQGWLQTYAEMLKGESILLEASKLITFPRVSVDQLRGGLSVQAIKDTLLLKVSYSYEKGIYAKKIVDTVASVFIQKMAEMNESSISNFTKKLETQIEDYQKQIDILRADLEKPTLLKEEKENKQNELKRLIEIKGMLDEQLTRQILTTQQLVSSVKVYQEGTTPTSPTNSRDSLTIAIGAVLGLFVGLLLAFLLEYLDDSIKTEEDIKKISTYRVLGVIPRFGLKTDSSYYYPYSQGKYYKKPV